jgi:hypothetical protein
MTCVSVGKVKHCCGREKHMKFKTTKPGSAIQLRTRIWEHEMSLDSLINQINESANSKTNRRT